MPKKTLKNKFEESVEKAFYCCICHGEFIPLLEFTDNDFLSIPSDTPEELLIENLLEMFSIDSGKDSIEINTFIDILVRLFGFDYEKLDVTLSLRGSSTQKCTNESYTSLLKTSSGESSAATKSAESRRLPNIKCNTITNYDIRGTLYDGEEGGDEEAEEIEKAEIYRADILKKIKQWARKNIKLKTTAGAALVSTPADEEDDEEEDDEKDEDECEEELPSTQRSSSSAGGGGRSGAQGGGGGSGAAFAYGVKSSVVWLECPYEEKDAAKSHGAQWDPDSKRWYVPPEVELRPFSRWIRSARTYLSVPPPWVPGGSEAIKAAKNRGAKFDGKSKRWYVPGGTDLLPFAPWR